MHASTYLMYKYKWLCLHVCMCACVYRMYQNNRCRGVCTHCDYNKVISGQHFFVQWLKIHILKFQIPLKLKDETACHSLPAGIIMHKKMYAQSVEWIHSRNKHTWLHPDLPLPIHYSSDPPYPSTPVDREARGNGTRGWIVAYSAEKQNKELGSAWICLSWSWVWIICWHFSDFCHGRKFWLVVNVTNDWFLDCPPVLFQT